MTRRNPRLTAVLVPAMLFAISSPASAQLFPTGGTDDAPAVFNDETVGAGRLVIENDQLEMGELFDTEKGHAEYKFRNAGSGPLTISHIKPSCGCTVPELEKKVYAPNETGVIRVDFDPKGKRGSVVQSIQVFTDSTSTPSANLTFRAFVKPIVVVEPNAVLNFMSLEKGVGDVKEIRVLGRFPEFEVTRATTDDPMNFDIEVVPAGEVEVEGEKLYASILKVTLKPEAKPGQLRTEISIRTNDERKPIFSMSAVARIMGDLQFSPARLTLGRLVVGDEFDREVRVTSRSGKPFHIKDVNLVNRTVESSFTFEPVDPENPVEWIIRITGKVLEPAARFNSVINVISDVKDEETSPMQIYGQLRPQ